MIPFWLGVLLAAAAAFVAHVLFWGRYYRVLPQQDEVRTAVTQDGWRLALGRRKPRGAALHRLPPVLLCHGLSANRGNLDFGIERYSLAAYLSQAGFDCFSLDLRGHGGSRKGSPRGWSFDTYLIQDIPAALDEIRAATGSAQVLWVGHSQGALLGLAAATIYPERITAVAALAPPTHFHAQTDLRRFLRFAFLATGRNRILARALAPIAGYLHPRVSQFAINTRNVDPRLYRALLANVIEDISPAVLRQFIQWARTDCFVSLDGKTDYRGALCRAQQPALFVAGAVDYLAPPDSVRAGYDLWSGPKDLFLAGKSSGLSADYGHSDMIFGRTAPDEIFPRVRDFLLAHSTEFRGHLP